MDHVQSVYDAIAAEYADKLASELETQKLIKEAQEPYSLWLWGTIGGIIGLTFGHSLFIGIIGALVALMIVLFLRPKYKKDYRLANEIANKAIVCLAKHYFERVEFKRYYGMSEDEFGRLFDEIPDDYSSDSLFKGTYNGLSFCISNVEATYEEEYDEEYTDSDGNTYTETQYETVEIFKGSILKITLPTDFKGFLRIGPFSSLESMDHIRFNRLYGIQCSDRIEARYILTQSFMDQLVWLSVRLGNTPEIQFSANSIYVMMQSSLDFGEPSFHFIQGAIERYLNQIEHIKMILDTIAFHEHHIIINTTQYKENT